MRLDHLLSKENRVFVLSLCGCWLAPGGGKFLSLFGVWFGREVVTEFLFSGEDRYRTWLYARVVWDQ